jgi:ketosteroid isomerase-like protein
MGFAQPEEHFPFAHILEFRNGRVVRFDHFPDTYKVARTLGFLETASR